MKPSGEIAGTALTEDINNGYDADQHPDDVQYGVGVCFFEIGVHGEYDAARQVDELVLQRHTRQYAIAGEGKSRQQQRCAYPANGFYKEILHEAKLWKTADVPIAFQCAWLNPFLSGCPVVAKTLEALLLR